MRAIMIRVGAAAGAFLGLGLSTIRSAVNACASSASEPRRMGRLASACSCPPSQQPLLVRRKIQHEDNVETG